MNNQANVDVAIIFLALLLIAVLVIAYASTTRQPPVNVDTAIPELTVEPAFLDWGIILNGSTVARTVALSNVGNATITQLSYTSTCTVGTLSWNLTGTHLPPNASETALFTLHAYPNATVGAFAFDITVTGVTEQ